MILKTAHHVYATEDRCWLANWRYHCWSYRRHGPGPPKHVLCHGKLVSPQSATILVTKTPIPDCNFAASIWPLLCFRWNHDILCASSRSVKCVPISYLTLPPVVCHGQGYFHRPGRSHVSYGLSDNHIHRPKTPERMVKPTDCHQFSVHMWIHRTGHRSTPLGLGSGAHPYTCCCWLHDRLRTQYRRGATPWPHGYHRIQVCLYFPWCSRCITNVSHDHDSTRAATFHVFINTLKGLGRTQKDAAFGLFGLFTLYAIRMTCDHLARRYPRRGSSCHSSSRLSH
jgi:hypothetical protein